ncbi:MAG: xanthine dehydrogenase family protein molybdopterin-binding subunit [Alphaproteobacteria bacterium]|nr:xanthine dehydrogenase family protein molybdopterin-binding subunit [Alphaproteobacteria bacterium]
MSIGQPLPRAEAPLKVTGRARYAADHFAENMLYAAYVHAPVAAGRVTQIDATAALAAPGVARVLTPADMPRFGRQGPPSALTELPMQDDTIRFEGQPVAVVLAETLEQALHAATLVRVRVDAPRFTSVPEAPVVALEPDTDYGLGHGLFRKGDVEPALARAKHIVRAAYSQPSRHHNAIEPSATLAAWSGGRIELHDATQHARNIEGVLTTIFALPPHGVRVLAPHTGGGFGSKGYVWPHEIIAAAAAKVVGRPVKLVMTRADMYANVGYQPATRQQLVLAADADGHLLAVTHDSTNVTAIDDDYVEFATASTRSGYAVPAMRLSQNVQRANINVPTPMRAPHEGPGSWALESAMDELAHAVGLDPLDLRLRNFAATDPGTGKPWSSNKLKEAYETGAQLFGWRGRPRQPVRDGDWLVGTGMAGCGMATFRFPAQARVRLRADGTAIVETSTHDIGTGTYTIFPQIAADVLGIDAAAVTLKAGDTDLPPAGPVYGSSSTMGTGSAVKDAAERVKAELARLTNRPPGTSIADAMRRAGRDEIVADGAFTLPGNAFFDDSGQATPYAIRTFGAVFVEVAVDPELGLLRLRRVVGSYSAGRIINPRTARSQMTGGIIWGWGMAAMEASLHEPRLGRWLSKNLSGVAIPVNADIPDITIHFVDEFDPHASPLGAKGIGELGATGVAAAVANAVFHATGKRIRDLPILPAALVS